MNKKKFNSTLSDISDELFAIEQDTRIADALQEDVLRNVFLNSCLGDGSKTSEGIHAIYFMALEKTYFAQAANMYVKKLLDDILILRQRVEALMEEGDPS